MKVICVGKLREKFYIEAQRHYQRMIEKMVPFSIIEVEKDVDKYVKKCEYVVLLDEHGREMDSMEFSSFLNRLIFEKEVCFVVGGWSGLKIEADFVLSLSKMTFPYQMARILLLEQIYRAMAIARGIDYHK